MASNFVKVMCNKNLLLLFSGTLNSFYALALSNFEQKFEKKNVNSSQRRENRKKADSDYISRMSKEKKMSLRWDPFWERGAATTHIASIQSASETSSSSSKK